MIDLSIFISPDEKADKFACFVTTGVVRKGEDGVPTLSCKLEFLKIQDFDKYEPFSKGKALIPTVKKIK